MPLIGAAQPEAGPDWDGLADQVLGPVRAQPVERARSEQPREAFWAESLLREYQQKYGTEVPRNKAALFARANEAYEKWMADSPEAADKGFDAWRRSKPIRGLLHPEEQKPGSRDIRRESLSEAMVMRPSSIVGWFRQVETLARNG